jgi:hypothetical protein
LGTWHLGGARSSTTVPGAGTSGAPRLGRYPRRLSRPRISLIRCRVRGSRAIRWALSMSRRPCGPRVMLLTLSKIDAITTSVRYWFGRAVTQD